MTPRLPLFDQSKSPDPVALQTMWFQLRTRGSPTRTHVLERRGPSCVVLVPATSVTPLVGILGLMAAVALAISLLNPRLSGLALIWAAPLLLLALGYGWLGDPRQVFDRDAGRVYIDSRAARFFKRAPVDFTDVHALQLVAALGLGRQPTLCSHQLNLVFHDGSRAPVLNHGDADDIIVTALALSELLEVPLWNADEALARPSTPA